MKGKVGLVVGLGVGYVLGTRAGRERYEQIKTQWLKLWHLDPVQNQVDKAKTYVGDKVSAVPGAVWTGLVKVVTSATSAGTPGQRLDSAIATGEKAADDVEDAVDDAVAEVKTAAKKVAAKKPSTRRPAAKKTSTNGN